MALPKIKHEMNPNTITNLLKLSRPHLFLLQNCTSMKEVMKFHAHFITIGLSNSTVFLSSILSFTALSPAGNLSYANLIFGHINSPNPFMFNTMIRGYASAFPLQAFSIFNHMLMSGLFPNNYTFPFVIKASARITDHRYGESVHCLVVKFGYGLDLHIVNSLLSMYSSFGFSEGVVKVFDEMPEPDVVSWNVVINDFAQCGWLDEVLNGFTNMCEFGIEPNSVTFLGLLHACTKSGDLSLGKLIHLNIIKRGICVTQNLGNGLLDMYAKLGDMDSAEKLFYNMDMKTVCSWTSMVDGFIQKGELEKAGLLFHQIPEKDTTSWNVMLNGYIIAGDMISADEIFKEIPDKDLVSWNCMVVGYAQQKNNVKTFKFFKEMLTFRIKPDRITLVSVLSVCQFSSMVYLGESIQCYMEKQNIKGEEVEVALMDIYCKCGDSKTALKIFDRIARKSVLAWTAMIFGLAINGLSHEALEYFNHMQKSSIKPNEITFIGVLCACSYGGLVEEGKRIFNLMTHVYEIEPRSEHFGCMVDMLGRAGLLKEAEIFIQNMNIKADSGIWGALLGACRIHGEVKMGERVGKILSEIDPHHIGRNVLLSNIYAADNRWVDAEEVRRKMKDFGMRKIPGFSLIELKG